VTINFELVPKSERSISKQRYYINSSMCLHAEVFSWVWTKKRFPYFIPTILSSLACNISRLLFCMSFEVSIIFNIHCAMQFGGSGTTRGRDSGFCITILHRATHRLLCNNSSTRKTFLSSPSHRTLQISHQATSGCSLL
jgi:hypothetical protein